MYVILKVIVINKKLITNSCYLITFTSSFVKLDKINVSMALDRFLLSTEQVSRDSQSSVNGTESALSCIQMCQYM